MKIATLGPKGSFSELACKKYDSKGEIVFCKNLKEVFELVEDNETDVCVPPLENLLDGSVGETLDLLYKSNLNIIEEIDIDIHHCIASTWMLTDIEFVLSHPKALGQCLEYIRKYGFETRETLSTSEAMKIVSERKDKKIAAIGTEITSKEYGLNILEKNIEDKDKSVTRFIVISKNKTEKQEDKKYKTGIAIHPKEDRPGLLHDILKSFYIQNINLTKIEFRPTKINLRDYLFYMDLEGHEEDKNVKKALDEISELAELKIFSSYERLN